MAPKKEEQKGVAKATAADIKSAFEAVEAAKKKLGELRKTSKDEVMRVFEERRAERESFLERHKAEAKRFSDLQAKRASLREEMKDVNTQLKAIKAELGGSLRGLKPRKNKK